MRHGKVMRFLTDEMRSDRQLVLHSVSHNGDSLQHVSDALKSDRIVVRAAVLNDAASLRFASSKLRADREIVSLAVMHNFVALGYASQDLKLDLEMRILAARTIGSVTLALELVKEVRRHAKGDCVLDRLEAETSRCVELLSVFPVEEASHSGHKKLHRSVEKMMRQFYHPRRGVFVSGLKNSLVDSGLLDVSTKKTLTFTDRLAMCVLRRN